MTPAWMTSAACTAPETRGLPWTTDAGQVPDVLAELMVETCEGCPVMLDCLTYAMSTGVTGGWWAGLDRNPHPDDQVEHVERGGQLVLFSLDVLGGAA